MPCPFLRPIAPCLLAVLCEIAMLAHAQEPPPVLVRVKDVLALPDEVAAQGRTQVRLRGVITDVSAKLDECSLNDGSGGVHVALQEAGIQSPPLGTEVEIEGRAFAEKFQQRQRVRVEGARITVLGPGTLPKPAEVALADVAEFRHLDQWIAIEGVVLQVRYSYPLFTVQVATKGATCNAIVRNWPRDNIPKDWVGGRVRLTGNNRAYLPNSNLFSMMVPSPAQLTVVKTGRADPFDAPVAKVSLLEEAGPTRPTERVKLTGTLLEATSGNVFYARTPDGEAFSFYMLFPLDEDKSGRFSTPIIVPTCKPGDVVEVVGIPGYTKPGVHLNFALVRPRSTGDVPPPVPSDVASVSTGRFIHDLVELHGRLLSLDEVLVTPGRWRTTMKLEDAGSTILASLDAPKRGLLTGLSPDHLLKVRAIVTGTPHFPEIRLWIREAEDVSSLGMASDVLTRRVWMWLGVASAIILTLAAWALMLRRSRTAIRELNAGLEKRVEERTAELAAAKDELSRALSHERELGELKTRFISLVSHEFRTPLGITMSAVELLRHHAARLSPDKLSELLEDIHSSTLRMSGLMEQVLLLGRVEAGKTPFNPETVNLKELCGKLVDETLSATHHRCPVKLVTGSGLNGGCADEGLMRHILGNLLSNAVKYSAAGSPVEFHADREGGDAVFTVRDHGIGIPQVDQARLFEAFHRASNVGDVSGTGLGLLLVKRCVELHHGSLSLESEEGQGTTFTVRLPVSEA